MKITLNNPLSVNAMYRGRRYKTKSYDAFKTGVGYQCVTDGITPLNGDLRLTINWYPKTNSGDTDNIIKGVQDSIEGYAYHNDRQISELHVYRMPKDKHNPRVELEIEVIE